MKFLTKKITSLIVLACFVATNSAQGFQGAGIEVLSSKPETPSSLQIEIPNELASIEEIYEAPARLDPSLILHIQNAHGNYEAQKQIKKLLEYLNQTYGFNLVFLEGAVDTLNRDYLNFFPDPENNRALADRLAQKGELTGAELYLGEAPPEVQAVGIEQAELYRANYEAFKSVHQAKVSLDAFLAEFSSKLETLSSGFFNPQTKKLLGEWRKFEAGHREFLPYARNLADEAEEILDLDLDNMFSQVEWPQITRLLVLQTMETELQKEKALQEKDLLVTFLKKVSVSEKLIQGIEKLEKRRIGMNRMMPGGEDQEDLPRYLLERLVEEAGPKGFYFHDYPAFSLYAGYLILESELESKALFEEIEHLFEKILNELVQTEKQKNLLELYRDLELLKKLFHLELTRKEWGRVSYRKDWIQPKAMRKRVDALIEKRGQARNSVPVPSFRVEGIASIFNTALRFYELARQRESVFYYTMKQEMLKKNQDKAILITGGFHTEGLMELFREEQVNYGVLTPRLTERIEEGNYVANMLQNRPTIFDLANLETVLNMQRSEVRAHQGMNLRASSESLMDTFLEVLKDAVKNRSELRKALQYFDEQSIYAKDNNIQFRQTRSEPKEDTYLLKLPEAKGKPEAYQVIFRENQEGISLLLKRGRGIHQKSRAEVRTTYIPRRELWDIQGIVFDALPLDENAPRMLAPVIRHLHNLTNQRKPRFQGELMEGRKVIGLVTFPNGVIRVALAPALALTKGEANAVAHIQLASRAEISKERYGYAQFGIDLDNRHLRIRPDIPAPTAGHTVFAEDMHDQVIKIAALLRDALKELRNDKTNKALYTEPEINNFNVTLDLPKNGFAQIFGRTELIELKNEGKELFPLGKVASLKLINFKEALEEEQTPVSNSLKSKKLLRALLEMAQKNLSKVDPELASGILFAEAQIENNALDETVQYIKTVLLEIGNRGYESDQYAKVAQNALEQVLKLLPQSRSEVRVGNILEKPLKVKKAIRSLAMLEKELLRALQILGRGPDAATAVFEQLKKKDRIALKISVEGFTPFLAIAVSNSIKVETLQFLKKGWRKDPPSPSSDLIIPYLQSILHQVTGLMRRFQHPMIFPTISSYNMNWEINILDNEIKRLPELIHDSMENGEKRALFLNPEGPIYRSLNAWKAFRESVLIETFAEQIFKHFPKEIAPIAYDLRRPKNMDASSLTYLQARWVLEALEEQEDSTREWVEDSKQISPFLYRFNPNYQVKLRIGAIVPNGWRHWIGLQLLKFLGVQSYRFYFENRLGVPAPLADLDHDGRSPVIYLDFKSKDTLRRSLNQVIPELRKITALHLITPKEFYRYLEFQSEISEKEFFVDDWDQFEQEVNRWLERDEKIDLLEFFPTRGLDSSGIEDPGGIVHLGNWQKHLVALMKGAINPIGRPSNYWGNEAAYYYLDELRELYETFPAGHPTEPPFKIRLKLIKTPLKTLVTPSEGETFVRETFVTRLQMSKPQGYSDPRAEVRQQVQVQVEDQKQGNASRSEVRVSRAEAYQSRKAFDAYINDRFERLIQGYEEVKPGTWQRLNRYIEEWWAGTQQERSKIELEKIGPLLKEIKASAFPLKAQHVKLMRRSPAELPAFDKEALKRMGKDVFSGAIVSEFFMFRSIGEVLGKDVFSQGKDDGTSVIKTADEIKKEDTLNEDSPFYKFDVTAYAKRVGEPLPEGVNGNIQVPLGPRQLLAYRVRLEEIAKDLLELTPEEVRKSVENVPMILHLSENTADEIIQDLTDPRHDFYGFSRQNVFFVVHESYAGRSLKRTWLGWLLGWFFEGVLKNTLGLKLWKIAEDHGRPLHAGNGYGIARMSWPKTAFYLNEKGERQYVKDPNGEDESIFDHLSRTRGTEIVRTHRINDLSQITSDVLDLNRLAKIEDLMLNDVHIVSESVQDPSNLSEGGYRLEVERLALINGEPVTKEFAPELYVEAKNVAIRKPPASGEEKTTAHEWGELLSRKNIPHHALRNAYRTTAVQKALKERGIKAWFTFDEGYLYPVVYIGDLTQDPDLRNETFMKKDEKRENIERDKVGPALQKIAQQDVTRFRRFAEQYGFLKSKGGDSRLIDTLLNDLNNMRHTDARVKAAAKLGAMEVEVTEAIDDLINHLDKNDEPDHVVRYFVIEALGKMALRTNEQTANRIAFELAHVLMKDSNVQANFDKAKQVLQEIGRPAVVPLIQVLVTNEALDIRAAAIEVLGKMGPVAISNLSAVLKNTEYNETVRRAFVKILVEIESRQDLNREDAKWRDRRISRQINQRINDLQNNPKDPVVSEYVQNSLAKLGSDAVPILMRYLSHDHLHLEIRRILIDSLGEIGPAAQEAIPYLISALESPSSDEIYTSTWKALGRIGTRAVKPLNNILSEKGLVREGAVKAFKEMGIHLREYLEKIDDKTAQEVIQNLTALLGDEQFIIQSSAQSALMSIGDRAHPVLINALQTSDNPLILRFILEIFSQTVGPESQNVVPPLMVSLKNLPKRDRYPAIHALGKIGEAAIPNLLNALKDNDYSYVEAAATALAEMMPRLNDKKKVEVAGKVITPLTHLFRDQSDPAAQAIALTALGKLAPKEKETLSAVSTGLASRNSPLRRKAAEVAGTVGGEDPEIVALLIKYLNKEEERDDLVRIAVIESLGKLALTEGWDKETQIKIIDHLVLAIVHRAEALHELATTTHDKPPPLSHDKFIHLLSKTLIQTGDLAIPSLSPFTQGSALDVQISNILNQVLQGIRSQKKQDAPRSELRNVNTAKISLPFKRYDLEKIDSRPLAVFPARFRVISISRGLLEPKVAEAAEIEAVVDTLSALDETAALKRFRALISTHALFGPPASPALAVIGASQIPSYEALEANVDLLVHSGRNQGLFYVVVPEKPVSGSEVKKLKDQVEILQGRKDSQGHEIGERFNVVVTNQTFAAIAFQKAIQKLAGFASRESKKDKLDPLTLQSQHAVLLLEKSLHERLAVDKDRINAHFLLSDSFDHPGKIVIRDLVVRLYAKLKGDPEKLNQELKDIVIVKRNQENEIVSASLDPLTAKLWAMIQSARAEIRTKASA